MSDAPKVLLAIEKLNKAQKAKMDELINLAGIDRNAYKWAIYNVLMAQEKITNRGFQYKVDDGLNVFWTIKPGWTALDPEMSDSLPPDEIYAFAPFSLGMGPANMADKAEGNYTSFADSSYSSDHMVSGIGQITKPTSFYKRLLVSGIAESETYFFSLSLRAQSVGSSESRVSLFQGSADLCGEPRDHGSVIMVSPWLVGRLESEPFVLGCDVEISEPREYIAKATTETQSKGGEGNFVRVLTHVNKLAFRIKAYLPK